MRTYKYKVVLVDDEFLVRELIAEKVNWELLDCELLLKATSASEVYDFIDENKVDIILTDINMPVIDGLAMSKRIREQYPNIKIIVLTGFDEFDYAKQSIEIGIDNYILKPIDENTIEDSMRKVIAKIEKETVKAFEYEQLRQSVRENKAYMKEKFFIEMIQQTLYSTKLNERGKYFEVDTESKFVQIIGIEFTPKNQGILFEEERLMQLYQARLMLMELVQQHHQVHVFEDSKERLILLNLNPNYAIDHDLDLYIRLVNQNLKWDLRIGVGRIKEQLHQSSESYQEALTALRYTMVTGFNQVNHYGDFGVVIESGTNQEQMEEDFENLEFSIKVGLKNDALLNIDKIYDKLSQQIQSHNEKDISYVRIQTSRILSVIYYLMLSTDESSANKEISKDHYEDINKIRSIPDAKQYIYQILDAAMERVNGIQSDREDDFIKNVERYISERISNSELNLTSTAEHFFLNPSYLSRLYKQKLGISFKEHIIKQRMEKAVELLRTTDLKVYEISDQVGIVDPNYFSLCFKKYMSMSVSEYKRSLSNL